MKRHWFFVALAISAVIVAIVCFARSAETKRVEKLLWVYLEGRGYRQEEILVTRVGHSFLGPILSYNEWVISVQFTDEPGSIYWYTIADGRIREAGVSGSTAKEDLKHGEETP